MQKIKKTSSKKQIKKDYKTKKNKKEELELKDSELEEQLLSKKLSELAERIKQSEAEKKVDLDQFQEFMQSEAIDIAGAPVLEKITAAQERPIFVGGISSSSSNRDNNEKGDPFKYLPNANQEDEKKYISSSSKISLAPETIDFDEIGRTPRTQQFLSSRPSESIEVNSWSPEKYKTPERADLHNVGREEFKKKVKYKFEPTK